MTDEEAAKVTQVSKGALNFPALGVTAQSATIVAGISTTSPAMGQIKTMPRASKHQRSGSLS